MRIGTDAQFNHHTLVTVVIRVVNQFAVRPNAAQMPSDLMPLDARAA